MGRYNIGLLVLLGLAIASVTGALLFFRPLTSRAVQSPSISLDMMTAGNAYDETTNTMTVGTIDNCLASPTANTSTHTHSVHLLVENVEDLVGWQVRFNYIGDKMRISTINFAPFPDTTTGQQVGFTNIPIDSVNGLHRDLTAAGGTGPPAPPDGSNTRQTHLAGATYNGMHDFAPSPDTPAKANPDDASYNAPSGGILATVNLQVVGDEGGQTLQTLPVAFDHFRG